MWLVTGCKELGGARLRESIFGRKGEDLGVYLWLKGETRIWEPFERGRGGIGEHSWGAEGILWCHCLQQSGELRVPVWDVSTRRR